MDFGALPPEVNSGRMYVGPGPATMLAASAGWDGLAAELHATASGYQAVVSRLSGEFWTGPVSLLMVGAVSPYLSWMRATAERCEQAAVQAAAAARAYEIAHAMTVPPPLIAANRAELVTLVATNLLGQNTPAIMATEAAYSEMWAQDATAMYNYAAGSASASSLSGFAPPPQTTNPGGLTAQAAGSTHRLLSSMPQALRNLATPGSSSTVGTAAGLGSSGSSAPLSALSSLAGPSGKGAGQGAGSGLGALSGLAAGAAQALNGDAAGLASDLAGLGADGAGLGADGGGLGIDVYGLSLDFEGAGSILGVEGAGSLGGAGSVAGLGQVSGLGSGAAAGLGQAS